MKTVLFLSLCIVSASFSRAVEEPQTIVEKTESMERLEGFFDCYWDENSGKIWLKIDRWNEAFEAIGFKDAFQVKILPEDAASVDVRYNVINWVHRSTRG
jgi:hypothetical protein